MYVFERPCCGACDLLCYSCTGRPRVFHRSRSSSTWGDTGGGSGDDASAPPAAPDGGGGTNGNGLHGNTKRCSAPRERGSWRPSSSSSINHSAPQVSLRGDNWLGTHEAGLLRMAGLHPGCEVVDANFVSELIATPYCVLIDHVWRCVVVSIRGTMSLEDCLCDLQADPMDMESCGRKWGFDGRGMLAHQGVVARAEWLRADLEEQGHLRALLSPNIAGEQTALGSGGLRRRCQGYSLRVTGHSLGGSTSVILSYMLRRDYPSVRCIAISPLGGLLNAPFAESCGDFVLSAALGDDVVPRLSVTAMERMRDEILDLISRTKANKLTVMRSMVKATSWGSATSRSRGLEPSPPLPPSGTVDNAFAGDDLEGLVYGQDESVPDTNFSRQLERYRQWVDQKRALSTFPELLPAGRFVHYVKTHSRHRCCGAHWLYTPVWAKPTDFSEIVVSKRMFFDHFPTRSCPRFSETFQMLEDEAKNASAQGGGGGRG